MRRPGPGGLVFLDETGAHTAMTRLYGRAPEGARVVDTTPQGHWRTTTLLASLRADGVIAPLVVEGPTDAWVFRAYVERVLAPELRPGDRVVLDNLAAHKAAGVAEALRAAGAEPVYLPPYSPDFNPIERAWSKVKGLVRQSAARTGAALYRAIAAALRRVTPRDCRNFVRGAGYREPAT